MGPEISDDDPEAIDYGRWLFTQPCDFVIGCASLSQVPETSLPEIAFAGRSNVGKSSLINALVGQNALARTSNTPGRTQQVNFFELGKRLMMADLPGYGYAKAPKDLVRQWTGLVNSYLKGRVQLRRTCVLIDARHGLKESDEVIMSMLDKAAQPYQIVLTKADKIKDSALQKLIETTQTAIAKHVASHPVIMPTSSRKGLGITELRASLAAFARPLE